MARQNDRRCERSLSPARGVFLCGAALQRDVELHARLVFQSIRDQVEAVIAAEPSYNVIPLFERLAEDERILALGFCAHDGQLRYPTRLMPKPVTCDALKPAKTDSFTTISTDGRPVQQLDTLYATERKMAFLHRGRLCGRRAG